MLLVNICVIVKWHDLKKKKRLFLGKQKRILGMLFAMVTQLSLINLSHMKQVPDYNTLQHGGVPGGFAPSAALPLTCRQHPGRAGLTTAENPIMCLVGSERGGPPPAWATGAVCPRHPKSSSPGSRPQWVPLLWLWGPPLSPEGRKEVFFLHFQYKVSFMRAEC